MAKQQIQQELETVAVEVVENDIITTPQFVSTEVDEFASEEFIDPYAKLPRIQAMRGAMPAYCGYFVPSKEMAKANFNAEYFEDDKLMLYPFESGETETGLLIKSPRMLVNPRTPLLNFDRDATKTEKRLVIVGPWNPDLKGKQGIGNCQIYEVILLDEQNRPIHSVPLTYVAKGANQATFAKEWNLLTQEITDCHAISVGVASVPKTASFKALCVFAFQVSRELVGTDQKSHAIRVTGHEVPTRENWKSYFVGYNQSLKNHVWQVLQPKRPPSLPPANMALPEGNNDEPMPF